MSGLFPMIAPTLETAETHLPICREPAWDFAAGKPIFRAGTPKWVVGIEAVRVWAWKALMTERGRYEIYSQAFGCEVESLIGQAYSDELKKAEAARYVREALEVSPYITDVSGIEVDFENGHLKISAKIETIYGEAAVRV